MKIAFEILPPLNAKAEDFEFTQSHKGEELSLEESIQIIKKKSKGRSYVTCSVVGCKSRYIWFTYLFSIKQLVFNVDSPET